MNKYIFMGPIGSGKGTQADQLARAYDLVHIDVGAIFRWNIQQHTKLGARVRRIVDAGQLVPDDIVEEVVRERLDRHDWNYGFVLDGFPRNRAQAEFFLENYDIDAVVSLDTPDAVVLMRVMGRRLCTKCGLDYNLILHRPTAAHVCDICGGRLATRVDDGGEAVHARLTDYHAKTEPAIDLFRMRGLVLEIDGVKAPDDVQRDIRERLMLADPPLPRVAVTAS
jgi:adenylate kinase